MMGAYCKVWLGTERTPSNEVFGVDLMSATLKMVRKKPSTLSVTWSQASFDRMARSGEMRRDALITWEMGYTNGESLTDVFVIKHIKRSYNDYTVTVEAADKSIPLAERVSTRVYTNAKASDVALDIARELGLSAEVLPSRVVYPTISTAGRTYGSLLQDLADDEDYDFGVKGQTLWFRPTAISGRPDRILHYRTAFALTPSGLLSFDVQRDSVVVLAGEKRATTTKAEDGKVTASKEGIILETEKNRSFTATPGASDYVQRLEADVNLRFEVSSTIIEQAKTAKNGTKLEATKRINTAHQETIKKQKAILASNLSPDEKLEKTAEERALYNAELIKIRDYMKGQNEKDAKAKDPHIAGEVMIERMPSADIRAAEARNAARARVSRYKGCSCSGAIYGAFIRAGERLLVEGVLAEDRGPWLIESTTASFKSGDIDVSFDAKTEPPESNKEGGKGKADDKKYPKYGDVKVDEFREYTAQAGDTKYKETQHLEMDFGAVEPTRTSFDFSDMKPR